VICPSAEQLLVGPSSLSRKRWPDQGLEAHSDKNVLQICKFGTPAALIHTQTIHARPPCSQRHGRNSRQTDLKAFFGIESPVIATRVVICLSPLGNGSNVPEPMFFRFGHATPRCRDRSINL
jgi:hypothetical protein